MTDNQSAYKPLRVLFVVILGVAGITLIFQKPSQGEDKIPWRTDLAAAQEEARRDGKPVLLYFTASWCGPCKRMKSETFGDATVQAKLREVVPLKVDIDANAPLARQYRIAAVPTFVLLGKDGKVAKEGGGFMPSNQFLTWLGG